VPDITSSTTKDKNKERTKVTLLEYLRQSAEVFCGCGRDDVVRYNIALLRGN
jgi:hypothetical protein